MSVSKDKKRGTWLYSGYYRDATNTRRQYCRRGFETKREAKEAERSFLEAAVQVRPSITLNELVLRYHEEYEVMGIKEATLISNESYYRNHIKDSLGKGTAFKVYRSTCHTVHVKRCKAQTKRRHSLFRCNDQQNEGSAV